MRLDNASAVPPAHDLLTLKFVDHIQLRRCQTLLPGIAEVAQTTQCADQVGLAYQEVQVPECAKSDVIIGLYRRYGSFERNGVDASLRQTVEDAHQFREERGVSFVGSFSMRAKRIEYVLGHDLRADLHKCPSHRTGQSVI